MYEIKRTAQQINKKITKFKKLVPENCYLDLT